MKLQEKKAIGYIVVLLLTCLFIASCVSRQANGESFLSLSHPSAELQCKEIIVQEKLSKDEYLTWFQAQRKSLVVKHDTLGYSYEISYQPLELDLIAFSREKGATRTLLDSIKQSKATFSYFTFVVSPSSASHLEKFKKLSSQNYALFDIQKDFVLVQGNDTLPCKMLLPMREHMQVSGQLIYCLAFEKKGSLKNVTLYYSDHLFQTDKREFRFGNALQTPSLTEDLL